MMLRGMQNTSLIQAMATLSANSGGITWDQAIDTRPDEVQAVISANRPSWAATMHSYQPCSHATAMCLTIQDIFDLRFERKSTAHLLQFAEDAIQKHDPKRPLAVSYRFT